MRRNLKFFICIILMTGIFTTNLYSATELDFNDIKSTDWFYEDVATLVDKTVINGYTDGSFRPDKSVSVAEFIKMAMTATNQAYIEPLGSDWYSKYVETAIAQGYILPTYYNDYKRPITRGEMGDIIDRILNLSYGNTNAYINKISDYDLVSSYHKESSIDIYIAGIITGYADGSIKSNNLANRSEAAVVIVRMIDPARRNPPVVAVVSDSSSSNQTSVEVPELDMTTASPPQLSYAREPVTKSISVDGIQVGMSEDYVLQHLGEPDERLFNQYGYEWFIYTGDYTKFKLLGIKDGFVVSFYSNVSIDSTIGLEIGTSDSAANKALDLSEFEDYYYGIYDGMNIRLYSDKDIDDGIEGALIYDSNTINIMNPTVEAIDTMEKVLFHITNGARVANGLSPLYWSNEAVNSSYSHSLDMAENNYFAHEDANGDGSKVRMKSCGVVGVYYAENIAAGYVNPFEFHYALMHSSGHRKNILTERLTHLGVGIYYDSTCKYKYYVTENFYEQQ